MGVNSVLRHAHEAAVCLMPKCVGIARTCTTCSFVRVVVRRHMDVKDGILNARCNGVCVAVISKR